MPRVGVVACTVLAASCATTTTTPTTTVTPTPYALVRADAARTAEAMTRLDGDSTCQSLVTSALGAEARDAMVWLLTADRYASPTIDADGSASDEAIALALLLDDPASEEATRCLFAKGSVAGKVYALIASWRVTPSKYHARRDELVERAGRDALDTQSGSVAAELPVEALLGAHDGAVQLPAGASFRDWWCASRERGADASNVLDFPGGAEPAFYLDVIEALTHPSGTERFGLVQCSEEAGAP